MSSVLAFPGVHAEGLPSTVGSISGVATAVAAFVGDASHGPINKAVRLLSFTDFERHFGGLNAGSELSYGVRQFFLNGGSEAWVVRLARHAIRAQAEPLNAQAAQRALEGGQGEPPRAGEAYNGFIADRPARTGIFALEAVDLFNLLVLPGVTDPGILMAASAYCQERRAFLIADAPPSAQTPDQMAQAITGTALPKSSYAAVYFPGIKIADPLNGGRLRSVAPGGTIAGLYARTDSAHGVWKAPAGTEATLAGVQAVDYPLTDSENAALNPLGVNCIRLFPAFGPVAWGARTLEGDDQTASDWKYIPVRRLGLFLEESLYRGTKWAVFEPNNEPLWAQIRLSVGDFMQNLFRQGAFQGQTSQDAYFVKCDKETTTQNDINLGVVNILVGFAPLKPAEFVVIKIQQMAGQSAR